MSECPMPLLIGCNTMANVHIVNDHSTHKTIIGDPTRTIGTAVPHLNYSRDVAVAWGYFV